ncbi:hypothetical protein [Streptomyces violaceusniger]|uniref:hypothetical protein n=1 Tax=Streptomyces violaceusniger TaxID=68280 RepID=UPI0036CEF68D
MFVFLARPATAGAVVAVTAESGTARPLAGRLLTGDAVVIVIVVLAVTVLAATGCVVPATLSALAAGGRLARASLGLHLDVRRTSGRAL